MKLFARLEYYTCSQGSVELETVLWALEGVGVSGRLSEVVVNFATYLFGSIGSFTKFI